MPASVGRHSHLAEAANEVAADRMHATVPAAVNIAALLARQSGDVASSTPIATRTWHQLFLSSQQYCVLYLPGTGTTTR